MKEIKAWVTAAGGRVPGQVYYTEQGMAPMPVIVNTVDQAQGVASITDPWGYTHTVSVDNLVVVAPPPLPGTPPR